MKFQVLDIIPHLKNPLTGEIVSTADRFNQVVETARRAEELGYDGFSVGERHAGEFISSSPTTVLAAIAAVTDRIRLQSGVTVLSVLDPVRVAEDYATIDQLSRGRLELVIGKGNEVLQYPLFGLDLTDQWDPRSLSVVPAADGSVELDFNRSVNLPCAYTDLATCPLPPAENRLPVAIEAGEKIPYERQDQQ